MKKIVEEKKFIFVITAAKTDTIYGGNVVIATGTEEELDRYKKQLIDNGHEDTFEIEKHEHLGWNTVIRFNGYELVIYDGLMYPKKNIDRAAMLVGQQVLNLKNTQDSLISLKEEVSTEEKVSYDVVINTLERKIEEVRGKKLNIQMT